jgi:hypothetical protein
MVSPFNSLFLWLRLDSVISTPPKAATNPIPDSLYPHPFARKNFPTNAFHSAARDGGMGGWVENHHQVERDAVMEISRLTKADTAIKYLRWSEAAAKAQTNG